MGINRYFCRFVQAFSMLGYKFCVRLYLNEDGVGKESHISLFFVLMRSPNEKLLSRPFRYRDKSINLSKLIPRLEISFVHDYILMEMTWAKNHTFLFFFVLMHL